MKKIKNLKIYIKGDVTKDISDLISKYLNSNSSIVFNSVKAELTMEVSDEDAIKDLADLHIYCLSPLYTGIDIYADVIDSCYTNPNGIVIFVDMINKPYEYTQESRQNIMKIITKANKITNRLCSVLNSRIDLIEYITEMSDINIKKNNEPKVSGIVNNTFQLMKSNIPYKVYEHLTPAENVRRLVIDYITQLKNGN